MFFYSLKRTDDKLQLILMEMESRYYFRNCVLVPIEFWVYSNSFVNIESNPSYFFSYCVRLYYRS